MMLGRWLLAAVGWEVLPPLLEGTRCSRPRRQGLCSWGGIAGAPLELCCLARLTCTWFGNAGRRPTVQVPKCPLLRQTLVLFNSSYEAGGGSAHFLGISTGKPAWEELHLLAVV